MVYEKSSKDIMRGFMVVSKELMEEIYERPRDMYEADELLDDPDRAMNPELNPDVWIGTKAPQWKVIFSSCAACDSFVDVNDAQVSRIIRRLVRNILVSVMNTRFPFLKLEYEPGVPDADTPPESVRQSQPSQQFQSCNSRGPGSHPSKGDFRSYGSSEGQVSARLDRAGAVGSDHGSVVSSTRPAVQLRSREALHSDSLELAQQQAAEAASRIEART